MHGIIITNQEVGHNAYKIERFKEEFVKKDISLEVLTNDGTLAVIENGSIRINLPKCDFVIYLDKDIYLARMLERNGYRLFNRADFIKLCDDKILTFISCSNLGIRMPKTIAGPLVYSSLKESNYNFLTKVVDELGFPMIVKKVYGSLGEGVYKVNDYSELKLKDLYSLMLFLNDYFLFDYKFFLYHFSDRSKCFRCFRSQGS